VGAAAEGTAEPSDLTPQQWAQVYDALLAQGVDAATAELVASDTTLAASVPVSSTFEEGAIKKSVASPDVSPMAIGTCSGFGKSFERIQRMKNIYGVTLLSIKVRTDFSYNNKRVTCASSSKSIHVDSVAALGGWYFDKWTNEYEGWYTYNGVVNGGVKTEEQGYFRQCILKVGCIGSATLTARTYAHYNGTWSTGGYTSGA
jgi:hypothetical protein